MIRRIGIAGYSGSGKSTVTEMLVRALPGVRVIDADAEAKRFIAGDEALLRRLVDEFGPPVMRNREVDFGFLGKAVFSSKEQLMRYNAIVHPPVLRRLKNLLDEASETRVVLDAALIPLWGIEPWFDACIWVHAPFAVRVLRLKSRGNVVDSGSVENRLCIQEEIMKEPDGARWVQFENEGGLDDLGRTVASFCQNA